MLRATLKSLLARKLRLTLSTIAVVLSVMFVSGSFVLTDTLGRSFDALFANVYTYVDVEVTGKTEVQNEGGAPSTPPFPASMLERVENVPGVAKAAGQVFANGARVVNKRGKLVTNQSGQRYGANWQDGDPLVNLAQGNAPRAADEVVINRGLAKAGAFAVGDPIDVITPSGGRKTFEVAGTFTYPGGRDSLAGEHTVFFTEPVAQQLMFGQVGVFNIININADQGVSPTRLRDDVKAALGPDFVVRTGDEAAAASAEPIKNVFKYINYVLLGFGAVALLVGIFLILNTFSIIVAQRTHELALLRAMGAGQGQVLRSVLLEAVLIGVAGSALGFAAGIGLGAGGAALLARLTGGIEVASLGVPPAAVISAFGLGITVTVAAALLPALKASRVAPIAAMREAAVTDRPLTGITVIGGVVTAAAGAVLGWGLAGAGDATLWLILSGVLGLLVGVALLTPLLSRPIVSVLGWVFSWSIAGKLGRRNSARNPRRTAITAAAVMIGIALITAISTVFTSLSASIGKVVEQEVQADLIVAGQQTTAIPPVIQPDELQRIRGLAGVDQVAAITYDAAKINGRNSFIAAYDDLGAAHDVLKLTAESGSLNPLRSGETIVDKRTATQTNVKLGDQVNITLARAAERSYTVVGITAESAINTGFLISMQDAQAGFVQSKPIQAYLTVKDGANVNTVKSEVDEALKANPEVTVQTQEEYVGGQQQVFDVILYTVQVLLLVAMAISVLGVINTLVLSVIERTRELGMLRAIGLRRSQTMRMITVESVVISLFGTVLGLAVGVGLGAAIVRALKEQLGFGEIALPWMLMIVYFVVALIIGVLAAIIPAVRAARLNVLNAIAYE